MDLGLRDKVAVITGASVGIGLAVAEGLAAEGAHIVMAARQPERLGGNETVLLCEDDDLVRALLEVILGEHGYTVLSSSRPKDAIALARQRPDISLLVTDVVMPQMGGPELVAKLTDERPDLRVVFLSGYTAETIQRRSNLPEGSIFLEKPFDDVSLALSLRPARLTGPQAVAKRGFDLALASVGVLATLPLWIVIATMVKLTSPGPVFFRQRRVGHRVRPFTILKFRTMRVGADEMLQELRALNEADGPLFKLRDDPRVTRVGRWLRRWSLDELPQILNVIRGDMSLVGPRPPLPEEVREYEEWQFDRLEVPPGITGLWQISGRSDLSFEEYVRLDLFYIENWSLAYDFFIVAKTIPTLLSTRGAY